MKESYKSEELVKAKSEDKVFLIRSIYLFLTCFATLKFKGLTLLKFGDLKSKWWIDGDYFVLHNHFITLVNELFLIIKITCKHYYPTLKSLLLL